MPVPDLSTRSEPQPSGCAEDGRGNTVTRRSVTSQTKTSHRHLWRAWRSVGRSNAHRGLTPTALNFLEIPLPRRPAIPAQSRSRQAALRTDDQWFGILPNICGQRATSSYATDSLSGTIHRHVLHMFICLEHVKEDDPGADVPASVHGTLKSRAAREGMSLPISSGGSWSVWLSPVRCLSRIPQKYLPICSHLPATEPHDLTSRLGPLENAG